MRRGFVSICSFSAAFSLLSLLSCAGTNPPLRESVDSSTEASAPAVEAKQDSSAVVPSDQAGDPVDALLKAMSFRDKLAQLFIVWIPKGADLAGLSILKSLNPGGYILYSWNCPSVNETRALTKFLSDTDPVSSELELSPALTIKPFICADQEGGRVAAFRFSEFSTLPSAFALGSLESEALIEATARLNAAQLAYLGVNMNLAPVADLYPVSDSTIIGDRSFGPDPEAAAKAVVASARGLDAYGILATLKHFPGHGVTTVDSHGRLPVSDLKLEDIMARELIPFAAGIRASVPVVMTAHIVYTAVDAENPATLSPVWLKDILRGRLGFDGIILTDGFEMGALTQSFDKKEALARALEAGIDQILLYSRYDPSEMIHLTETLVSEGRITPETVESAVRRILEAKYRFGLLCSED